MHKDEAAFGFSILANPDATKVCKMLYVLGELSEDRLYEIIGCDLAEFKSICNALLNNNMIFVKNGVYSINKPYMDELLDFIKTPCGCAKK